MIKAPISLQDLRRRIYVKAKAEPSKVFWGLYVHVCKMETLREAYVLARSNDGAPGIDGMTFDAIEGAGVQQFLEQIRDELSARTYLPTRNRLKAIPKGNGKVRVLGIPTIRDRVVQGALKLILEPIFEADFQPGSFGYRPKRKAHDAVALVVNEIAYYKTRIIDVDLRAFFDNVQHDLLLAKIARRISDADVLHLVRLILKASGKKGVPQGGVISPLFSNIYLDSVDRMLERAKAVTHDGFSHIEYARYADDLVILVDAFPRHDWLLAAVTKRLREELAKLKVEVNEDKSKIVDLAKGESFGFLGFDIRRVKSLRGKWRAQYTPKLMKRTALVRRLKTIFRQHRHQRISDIVATIDPILRGFVNYFGVGHSSRCFSYIRDWVAKKTRRHLMRARARKGMGWKRWSTQWLYTQLGLFDGYRLSVLPPPPKALPVRTVS